MHTKTRLSEISTENRLKIDLFTTERWILMLYILKEGQGERGLRGLTRGIRLCYLIKY